MKLCAIYNKVHKVQANNKVQQFWTSQLWVIGPTIRQLWRGFAAVLLCVRPSNRSLCFRVVRPSVRVYVRARAVALPTGLSSTSSFVFHYQLFLGGHLDKTPSSLASFKSRLVLPFWYRLTQVVLEKRPLNGYSVVVRWRFLTFQNVKICHFCNQRGGNRYFVEERQFHISGMIWNHWTKISADKWCHFKGAFCNLWI